MSGEVVLKLKSKPGICLAAKPREAFIVNVDKHGIKSEPIRVGLKPPDNCQHCGKPWSEH